MSFNLFKEIGSNAGLMGDFLHMSDVWLQSSSYPDYSNDWGWDGVSGEMCDYYSLRSQARICMHRSFGHKQGSASFLLGTNAIKM